MAPIQGELHLEDKRAAELANPRLGDLWGQCWVVMMWGPKHRQADLVPPDVVLLRAQGFLVLQGWVCLVDCLEVVCLEGVEPELVAFLQLAAGLILVDRLQ